MYIQNATTVRQKFFETLEHSIKYDEPVYITHKHGTSVLISQEEFETFQEMQFFYDRPKLAAELIESKDVPEADFMDEFEW